MAFPELVTVGNEILIYAPPGVFPLNVTCKSSSPTQEEGDLLYNNAGNWEANTSQDGDKSLAVQDIQEGLDIGTAPAASQKIRVWPIRQGAQYRMKAKDSFGGCTKDVTVFIPSTAAGRIEIYTKTLALTAGSCSPTAAVTQAVAGNYLPPVRFLAKETVADDADGKWVIVEVL